MKELSGLARLKASFSWLRNKTGSRRFVASSAYWERRYAIEGDSGAGSTGNLSRFKAEVVNDFMEEQSIKSVVEFGSGDGRQLDLLKVPCYVGLDVSKSAVVRAAERHRDRINMSFFLYDSGAFFDRSRRLAADLTLSLDVIYHLVEDETFHAYMRDLFSCADRYVVIYSSDFEFASKAAPHVRHRKFSLWVEENEADWDLVRIVRNPYPFDPRNPEETSHADFYIYARGGLLLLGE